MEGNSDQEAALRRLMPLFSIGFHLSRLLIGFGLHLSRLHGILGFTKPPKKTKGAIAAVN
jgi:hypothetical protein